MSRKRVALIGSPLRRRHSAVMHNAAFDHFGIDATYELMEIDPDGLDGFFADARSETWLGFQVTAPYKQVAASRADTVEESARRIGAVNSVVRCTDGSLVGFNTDADGFARSVVRDLGLDMAGIAVAVAGAGGAARAVVHACLALGAARVVVGARSPTSVEALVAERQDDRLEAVGLGRQFDERLGHVALAVNATTVGMATPGMVFDPDLLASGTAVFDLVYVPSPTPLVARAREVGLCATDGLGMLVGQAEMAFERWTGVADAGPVMRAALSASSLCNEA